MRGAELWTCHPCPATLEGVRVAEISSLSEDESRAHRLGGQRRSEELRCILTQGRPELSRASRVAAGGGEAGGGGGPHVRGACPGDPSSDPYQPKQGPCSQATGVICRTDVYMHKAEVSLTPNARVLWLRNQDTAQFPTRARVMPKARAPALSDSGPWWSLELGH